MKKNPKIFAVWSGKGGVGKTTLTLLLAEILLQKGVKVGILDADLYGPSLGRMLTFDQNYQEKDHKIFPAMSRNLKVLSISMFSGFENMHSVRAPIVNQILTSLSQDVAWGDLDVLLIDMPPGTGDIHITISQSFHLAGAFLVSMPGEVAVRELDKSILFLRAAQVPILGLIENMGCFFDPLTMEKFDVFGRSTSAQYATQVQLRFFGQLPLLPALAEACALQMPLLSLLSKKSFSFLLPMEEIAIEIQKKMWDNTTKNNEVFLDREGKFLLLNNNQRKRKISAGYLEKHCPCSHCLGKHNKTIRDVKIVHMEEKGNGSFQFTFSAGCNSGIFSFGAIWDIAQQCD